MILREPNCLIWRYLPSEREELNTTLETLIFDYSNFPMCIIF